MEHTLRQMPNLPSWLSGLLTAETWQVIFLDRAVGCYLFGGGDFCCLDDSV